MTKVRNPMWQDRGACVGLDVDLFFPAVGTWRAQSNVDVVRKCFGECPVQAECLDWALANNEHGIWGGTSREDRAKIKRGGPRKSCPGCHSKQVHGGDGRQVCMGCGLSWHTQQLVPGRSRPAER